MLQIYNYDLQGYYTTSSFARENPLVPGEYLMPARSTASPPPSVNVNQIAKWSGNAWSVDIDYRGKWYDVDTQTELAVWDAGEPQPSNTTSVMPPANEPTWVFTGSVWERTLDVAKAEKTAEMWQTFDTSKETYTVAYNGRNYTISDLFVSLLLGGITIAAMPGSMVSVYAVDHEVVNLTKTETQDLLDLVYSTSIALTIQREDRLHQIMVAGDIPTVDAISW